MPENNRISVTDGLGRRNAVLAEGMVIAPIVVCCDTLFKALLLSLAFAVITLVTVFIGSFYPKRLVYALRVSLYALTAAAVYIPAALLCQLISPALYEALASAPVPGIAENAGNAAMYLPLLAVNSFIVLHSELYFYRMRRGTMLLSLLFHIAGFALTACIIGAVRELLACGTVAGHVMDMPLLLRGFAMPWAGFVVLGVLCALHRAVFPKKQEES